MKILIVEDDYTSRIVLHGMLKAHGECDLAENGEQAVEAFRAALEAGSPYDLICLDIMMPGMDGQAVLERIRAMEKEKGRIMLDAAKVMMTTALEDSRNIMRSFRSQCDAYLVKPVDKDRLLDNLRALGLLADG
ncbi:MAG: Transcriptional activator protein CzcR [candidate division BRC1 bacterium ADurb.BinA364]|nr:MAG: Transcriptional activator protein CzcR [candidate division BRC1 bacterium ADurb.BinA364]